jgi:ATP-dependent RNA helicase RhlE
VAISFCDHEERGYLRDIERLIRMSIPSTDRRTGERPRPEPAEGHHAAHRQNGRPHNRGNQQQRGHKGKGGGNGHQGRQNRNGHHAGRPQGARPEATAQGEPTGMGNVTFMQRSGEPRRNAGHRAPR